jgi:hypothetical protein
MPGLGLYHQDPTLVLRCRIGAFGRTAGDDEPTSKMPCRHTRLLFMAGVILPLQAFILGSNCN